jgi:hypothetical protein
MLPSDWPGRCRCWCGQWNNDSRGRISVSVNIAMGSPILVAGGRGQPWRGAGGRQPQGKQKAGAFLQLAFKAGC